MARTGDSAAAVLEAEVRALRDAEEPLYVINMGGTAIGSGLNAPAGLAEKIASDLILLASGPHAELAEINLAAMQPGSSVMHELMNLVAFRVMGNDLTVAVRLGSGEISTDWRLAG